MQQVAKGIMPNEDRIESTLMPWIICFVASLFFFYEFIQGNMFASIADNIMEDFHIQADKMTYLSSAYYFSNVLFLFVAGMMLDRFSTKKIMMGAMLLCVLSTFVLAFAHDFYLALGCRFITGIGSAFCFLGPVRIASRWFPPQKMALVTGTIVTIAMTGGFLAQYPLTKLVLAVGWRYSLICVGWLGVTILLCMFYWLNDKSNKNGASISRQKTNTMWALAKMAYWNPQAVRAALYTSLMNMAVAVFGAMMGVLYLVQRLGISKEQAAAINSMLFIGAIVGGPCCGWFSDKLGRRVLPMKIAALISLVIILIILYLPVSVLMMACLFFLLGFFTAAQVISYALVAESSPPAITATAVSLVSFLTQGGYIIYQNLFSKLLIFHGDVQFIGHVPVYSLADYQTASLIFPLGLALAFVSLLTLKETYGKSLHQPIG